MPAAGEGARLGINVPKALVEVGGLPLFVQAAFAFLDLPECREVVIASPPVSVGRMMSLADHYFPGKAVRVTPGGRTRQESVKLALETLSDPADVILVHDAARPFVSREVIERVLDAMTDDCVAVVPALPITDTIKRVAGHPPCVEGTVDRRGLYAVQTPQAVRRSVLQEAYRRLANEAFDCTDDVSLIEHFGLGRIRLVDGDPVNFKITSILDLQQARDRVARSL